MLWVVNLFTPVRVTEMSEVLGLDESLHGEHAYETLEVEGWLQGEPHGLIEQIDRLAKQKNWPAPRNSSGGAGT